MSYDHNDFMYWIFMIYKVHYIITLVIDSTVLGHLFYRQHEYNNFENPDLGSPVPSAVCFKSNNK